MPDTNAFLAPTRPAPATKNVRVSTHVCHENRCPYTSIKENVSNMLDMARSNPADVSGGWETKSQNIKENKKMAHVQKDQSWDARAAR